MGMGVRGGVQHNSGVPAGAQRAGYHCGVGWPARCPPEQVGATVFGGSTLAVEPAVAVAALSSEMYRS